LFSDEFVFQLPYFQRGYAWKVEHVLRLLKDLLDAAEGRKPMPWYPLGVIILAKADGRPESWLADGHQRLISLTLLIAILRDFEQEPALKARLAACIHGANGRSTRLNTQSGASDCLANFVQEPGATQKPFNEDLDKLSDSELHILQNRTALRAEIGKLSGERCRRLAEFVLADCLLVVMQVENEEVARALFSTMHDTGIRPTPEDLFKARLLGVVEESERESAQDVWESVEARLKREQLSVLLGQLSIIAERKRVENPIETLDKRYDLHTPKGARTFIDTRLQPVGRHLFEVIGGQLGAGSLPAEAQCRLQYLSLIRSHDNWLTPVLHWLDTQGGGDDPRTLEFIRRIEALAWMLTINGLEPQPREERYLALIGDISAGKALSPGSRLHISGAERTLMRQTLASPTFIRRRYKQFLLLRANGALEGDQRALALPDATVEHILPVRPRTNSQWLRDFSADDIASLRQSLGNLALLTKDEQGRADNKDFWLKRAVYANATFALTRRIADQTSWRPVDVRRQTQSVIDLLMKSWGLA
jgi:hypothetical protein